MRLPDDGLVAQDMLRQLLDYDPATGKLTWKVRDRKFFKDDRMWKSWNARYAGKPAMASRHFEDGHYCGTIFQRPYKAHRIIWVLMTGEWPNIIDHENGQPWDNRWINLANGTHQDNQKNVKRRCTNKSGVTGVWLSPTKGYQVRIKVDGRSIHLGYFKELDEAARVRKQAEQKYGFHPNHGREA